MNIEAMRELKTLASVCPELNMANYTEDDVRHLNDWAIEMSLLVERYTLSQQPAQATQAEVTDAAIDAATRHIYHNGRPTSKEYRVGIARAILSLRPERVPMADEQIRSMCKQGWVFETVRQWVHVIEAHHGIKPKKE